jgi:hypothetical protein
MWFKKRQELMEIKSVDGRAKNYLQIRIQIDDAPIICILEPV